MTTIAALTVAVAPHIGVRAEGVVEQARSAERLARLHGGLAAAVRRAGGRDAVVARGAPRVNRAFETRLAWETTLTIGEVERATGAGLVFVATAREAGRRAAVPPGSRSLARAGRPGAWQVLVTGPKSVVAALKPGDGDVNASGTFR